MPNLRMMPTFQSFLNSTNRGIFQLVLANCGLTVSIAATHCNGNPIYVFLFWEMGGLSSDFHIHLSVSDLYRPRIGLHVFPPAE
jgi:hypothetical protein